MLKLANYRIIEPIKVGISTVIYRGQNRLDQRAVIIKALKSQYPTLEEIARLKNEYEITKNLKISGIIKSAELIGDSRSNYALVLEDIKGQSLKEILPTQDLTIRDCLRVAIALAETLSELHNHRIIHKDIKPSNIIINRQNEIIKITDFSIASRLSTENKTGEHPNSLEGTLAYMSPEQTGRMNRAIDYRTDFYSLGITCYEMLTGMLPFSGTDALEVVHCHIAKTPIPPHQLNSEIPLMVSKIVMKLLAKTAEERYQSALGLKVDLEHCLAQLETDGNVSDFPLGRRDQSSQLLIPQKLYGREAEVATLIAAFERVSTGESNRDFGTQLTGSEMILVAGYSGIGKSALVNEIHKPIVAARGYFIGGKFDQYKRNIPYSSIIQAFQSLMRQLLTESAAKIESWKQKLLQAFGTNGQVIIDVIPEVELIVGQQPPLPQLGPTESQNRFNRIFQEFIHVFCQKEHPLVLFLDDLQWADSASLKLIKLLVTDPDSKYLLVIGAYRDNEVSATHPLTLTVQEIQKTGAIAKTIHLGPLALNHINEFIADTLKSSEKKVEALSELLLNKTAGNPFFLTQILKSLYAENLLVYQAGTGSWEWEIERIQAVGITDNVVDLTIAQIQKLPETTQNVLKLAACIGNHFNLELLAIVNEKSAIATAAELWPALQNNFVLPLSSDYKIPLVFSNEGTVWTNSVKTLGSSGTGNDQFLSISYKFLHDRIQQAAYGLIPEHRKKAVHLQIGQRFLKEIPCDNLAENIFDIVNHLNIGADLIGDRNLKDELAALNLLAGQRAKAATAYEAALRYLNTGIELLADNRWQEQYNLTLNLYTETLEAEFLNTNFERAEQLSEIVLQQTQAVLDKVKVYEIKIKFYVIQYQTQKSIDTGLELLKILGVDLSKNRQKMSIKLREELLVELENVGDLLALPEMTDPYGLATMRILMNIASAAYQSDLKLSVLVILTMVKLSLQYGNSSLSAYGYAFYSSILCSVYLEIESAYPFGGISLQLLERFNALELKAKVINLLNIGINHFQGHLRTTLTPLQESVQTGIEVGDLEFAFYNANIYCLHLLFLGEHLDCVQQKQVQYLEMMEKLKLSFQIHWTQILKQVVSQLSGNSIKNNRLETENFNEAELLKIFLANNAAFLVFTIYFSRTIVEFFLKKTAAAAESAMLAEKYEQGCRGMIYTYEFNFYFSLALLADIERLTSVNERKSYLKKVALNQKKMKHWAEICPVNYQHKYDLVEAEKARIVGKNWAAMDLYERAIKGAKEQGYIQEEALAWELAGEFYLSKEKEEIARTYLMKARDAYLCWGAIAKVQDLESRYARLLSEVARPDNKIIDVTVTTSTTGANTGILDLATMMKASLAISSEIVLENLLHKLMKIAIENVGAQTGFLIGKVDDEFVIEVSGSLDHQIITQKTRTPLKTSQDVPVSAIEYVAKTHQSIILNDATREESFRSDPYILRHQPKSILCTPILHQGQLIGIFYFENNLASGVFTANKLEVLKLLSSQIAISLENARLYSNLSAATENLKSANEQLEEYSRTLEMKVAQRTSELQEKNCELKQQATQLERALQELKTTQTQLIQTEKMSSLGQMVAGVAHEINNPVNFIYGNLAHTSEYIQNLFYLLEIYQKEYSNPTPPIVTAVEEIELDYITEDLPKILSSMKLGADRIRSIVLTLRNFSRLDEAEMKPVDLHEGINSTLLILQHRLKDKTDRPAIQVIKEYGHLPLVECYAGQLNQVFMNILNNAIDAFTVGNEPESVHALNSEHSLSIPRIHIRTEALESSHILIRITDNGPGMTEDVRLRVFDPFFTTKPIGSGTGLGLSICYQIVVEKHGGQLTCHSAPGQGAEFAIAIPLKPNLKS